MTKEELLSKLNFGAVDSESEVNLDKIFVQTQNFKEFLNPNTALLLGSKGAGKSALYRLFTMFEKSAREMAGDVLENTSIVAGTGFKDLPEMDDMQLLNSIEAKEISPEAAWKIYIAYKVVHGLYEKETLVCGKKCRRVLQQSRTIPDYRISAIITRLFERFVGEPPQIDRIDFKDVSISLGKNSKVSIYDLLAEIDVHLGNKGKTVWVLLDKIDELFPSKTETRKGWITPPFLLFWGNCLL